MVQAAYRSSTQSDGGRGANRPRNSKVQCDVSNDKHIIRCPIYSQCAKLVVSMRQIYAKLQNINRRNPVLHLPFIHLRRIYYLLAFFLSGCSSSSSLRSAYIVFGCVCFHAFVNKGSFSASSAYFSNASLGSSSLILLSGIVELI